MYDIASKNVRYRIQKSVLLDHTEEIDIGVVSRHIEGDKSCALLG